MRSKLLGETGLRVSEAALDDLRLGSALSPPEGGESFTQA
jgi:hypothetical protein